MIRTIALLKWLTARLQALTLLLDDLRERTTGLALTATTEKLVATRQKLDDTYIANADAIRKAAQKREEDHILAEARYQDTVSRMRKATGLKAEVVAAKCGALESKRKALRAELTTG